MLDEKPTIHFMCLCMTLPRYPVRVPNVPEVIPTIGSSRKVKRVVHRPHRVLLLDVTWEERASQISDM
jgi:hypothetical protein